MDVKRIADKLARKYGSRDPFKIVHKMNVILIRYPLDGIRGFYQYFQRNNLIYINDRLSEHEQLFVCAHELGHMMLHKRANAIFMDSRTYLSVEKYEIEADRFAMNLLISDSNIKEHQFCDLQQLSRFYGYSQELIRLRIRDLV